MIGEFKEAGRDEQGYLTVTFIVDEDTDIGRLEKLKGKDLQIKVEKFSGDKTTQQNRYFWELMGKLGDALGISQWTAYLMILSYYGVHEDVWIIKEAAEDFKERLLKEDYRYIKQVEDGINGMMCLRCYKGLHLYSVEEARKLIDAAVQEAKDQDIEVLPDYLLNQMYQQ